jgi:hypothetical protein
MEYASHRDEDKGRSSGMEDALGTSDDTAIEDSRPFWIPAGVDLDSLPEELQVAIAGIVNPAYRELVLCAEPGLEQSTGLTVVHLLWLEILDQVQLGQGVIETRPGQDEQNQRESLIAQHLRTVGAKNKTTNLLLRLREFRRKCVHQDWGM